MRLVHGRSPILLAALLATVLPTRSALGLDLVSCGPDVPAGVVAVLQSDVVCPPGVSIVLGRGATLQLNGHSITAESEVAGHVAIGCVRGRCQVVGPGEVRGFGGIAIAAFQPSRLVITDVVVRNNGVGLNGDRVEASGTSFVANSSWGASAHVLRATNVSATGNGQFGLGGRTIRGSGISASDNLEDGLRANRISVDHLAATGNGRYGVTARFPGTTAVRDSNVTANGAADVASQGRPVVRRTSCTTSRRLDSYGTNLGSWGVCSAD